MKIKLKQKPALGELRTRYKYTILPRRIGDYIIFFEEYEIIDKFKETYSGPRWVRIKENVIK